MSLTNDQLLEGFKNRDRNALAKAITLVESTLPVHQQQAAALMAKLPAGPSSKRVGISGTPGVGKSSFIEVFGLHLTGLGLQVAVLAVDPTSVVSGGSILGDKTRMENLARDPRAFIRPSPSGGALGGVARRTREAIRLCEAFGFDVVLVETVGVGQSETAVARLTDCFLMLLQPGAGDDLQGIKRGILELVDAVVVTKADGDNKTLAAQAVHHYEQALHILRQEGWRPPVLACSAWEKKGLAEVWEAVGKFYAHLGAAGLEAKRHSQGAHWLDDSLNEELRGWFERRLPAGEKALLIDEVSRGKTTVAGALARLLSHLP